MRPFLAAALLLALGSAAYAQPPETAQPGDAGPGATAPANPASGVNRPPPSPQMMAARRAMRQACAPDLQTFCADAQTTGQRPMQCMRQHMSQLSPGCLQAIQTMRAARAGGGPQG